MVLHVPFTSESLPGYAFSRRLVGKQEAMRLLRQNHLHAGPPSLGSVNAARATLRE